MYHSLSPDVARHRGDEFRRAEDRADFRAGVRAMAPIVVAYVPVALLVGTTVAASPNPLAAWTTSTIYGAAAHLAVLEVLAEGAGWAAATAIGLLINARLAAYATAMIPEWQAAPAWRRAAAGLMLSDAPWAIARDRHRGHQQYYLGAAVLLFVCWPLLVSVGVLVGGRLVAIPVAALLLPLSLGAVVAPQLRHRPVAAACVAASGCAAATTQLTMGIALALAGVVGGFAGIVAERSS